MRVVVQPWGILVLQLSWPVWGAWQPTILKRITRAVMQRIMNLNAQYLSGHPPPRAVMCAGTPGDLGSSAWASVA
jgi:hypothetical protein